MFNQVTILLENNKNKINDHRSIYIYTIICIDKNN